LWRWLRRPESVMCRNGNVLIPRVVILAGGYSWARIDTNDRAVDALQNRACLGRAMGRVDLGGRPPRPPTDPDVRVKRIWLFIS
jgi:hypothetical protein